MFTTTEIKIHVLKKNNPNFSFGSSIIKVNRAGIEINNNCPQDIVDLLREAISKGWIEPVAYMSDREMVVNGLLRE